MREVLAAVERVATTDATVLVHGETGSGKEVVARAIHARSRRAAGPFVAVNCGAIPRDLVESALFGHEKGAFTGAAEASAGVFERADGSTLFLDEVSELDTGAQAKLLRVLQEREITRVGADAPRRVDVRIVAATNRELGALVRDGRFREDLYYRLAVIPLRLPPLRFRPADLDALLDRFAADFAAALGRPAAAPPPEVRAAARAYPWPGNVRELRNLCERAALLGWDAVLPVLAAPAATVGAPTDYERPLLEARAALVERFEREYLERLLRAHRGRVGEVARAAGIAERNLYEKMKAYRLSRDDYR
jgi:two-component system response regulator AtoC